MNLRHRDEGVTQYIFVLVFITFETPFCISSNSPTAYISVELEAMEEHLKTLEGVVERLETITGVSPPKVTNTMAKMMQMLVIGGAPCSRFPCCV